MILQSSVCDKWQLPKTERICGISPISNESYGGENGELKNKLKNTLVSMCKYAIHKNNDLAVNKVLEISNFDKDEIQPEVTKLKDIIFVTPYMSQHSGGLTSVLRIAQRLSELRI